MEIGVKLEVEKWRNTGGEGGDSGGNEKVELVEVEVDSQVAVVVEVRE